MRKETTVLLICLLILFADILGIRQTLDLWLGEKLFLNDFSGIAILISLGGLTALLLWINYLLVRKILGRQMN
ncbi:MAG: hypothetical protein R2747_00650 [Pyrinomonadaceae bacterium]